MPFEPAKLERARGIQDLLRALDSQARAALKSRFRLPGRAGVAQLADAILQAAEASAFFERFDPLERGALRALASLGGVMSAETVRSAYGSHLGRPFRALYPLGLAFFDRAGTVYMPLEFIFSAGVWRPPAPSLVGHLQHLGRQGLARVQGLLGLERSGSLLAGAAAIYRRFDEAWPDLLTGLPEDEAEILEALALRGYAGDFAPGADPVGRWIEDVARQSGSSGCFVREGDPASPLLRLALKGLVLPAGMKGTLAVSLVVPSEARSPVSAWRRARIRAARSARGPRDQEGILPTRSPAPVLDLFKRLLLECMGDRIRLTQRNTINKQDWKRLAKRLKGVAEDRIWWAFRRLIELDLLRASYDFQNRERRLVLDETADAFLPLQGRDRDRYVWIRLNEDSDYWSVKPLAPYVGRSCDEGPVALAEILRFLPDDHFLALREIVEDFVPSPEERIDFEELFARELRIFCDMGWVVEGRRKGERFYRRTETGSEIAAQEPRAIPPPPRPERPLLVQPNGRVVADPATRCAVLRELAVLGEIVSVEPAYCFQLTPDRLRRAASFGAPEVGARAFLERHASAALPATVTRLIEDVARSVVAVDLLHASAIAAADRPEAAARFARHPAARRYVAGVVGRFIIIKPNVSLAHFLPAMKSAGFRVIAMRADAFCEKQGRAEKALAEAAVKRAQDPRHAAGRTARDRGGARRRPGAKGDARKEAVTAEAPEEGAADPRAALERAAGSGRPVEILYRFPGRGNPAPRRIRVVVHRLEGRRILAREEDGRDRRLVLGRVVRVDGDGRKGR